MRLARTSEEHHHKNKTKKAVMSVSDQESKMRRKQQHRNDACSFTVITITRCATLRLVLRAASAHVACGDLFLHSVSTHTHSSMHTRTHSHSHTHTLTHTHTHTHVHVHVCEFTRAYHTVIPSSTNMHGFESPIK